MLSANTSLLLHMHFVSSSSKKATFSSENPETTCAPFAGLDVAKALAAIEISKDQSWLHPDFVARLRENTDFPTDYFAFGPRRSVNPGVVKEAQLGDVVTEAHQGPTCARVH